MIMIPPMFSKPKRLTQAELDLALLQQKGRAFWNALAQYQKPTKRKKK